MLHFVLSLQNYYNMLQKLLLKRFKALWIIQEKQIIMMWMGVVDTRPDGSMPPPDANHTPFCSLFLFCEERERESLLRAARESVKDAIVRNSTRILRPIYTYIYTHPAYFPSYLMTTLRPPLPLFPPPNFIQSTTWIIDDMGKIPPNSIYYFRHMTGGFNFYPSDIFLTWEIKKN